CQYARTYPRTATIGPGVNVGNMCLWIAWLLKSSDSIESITQSVNGKFSFFSHSSNEVVGEGAEYG
ncbi:MAG: hypothetical protein NTV46_15185, partial [Verrucomicrobia bacterium]|nr:hypothetical protein [Verrucomicrobiota bacterium]